MDTNKKIIILFCSSVLMLFILAIIPKEVNEIGDAVVNPLNGDIAITYSSEFTTGRILTVYDKNGEKLYSKSYFRYRGFNMKFVGDELCVVVGMDNEKSKYSYDREGNETNNDTAIKEIEDYGFFVGWHGTFDEKYTLGEYEYIYEKPHIFRHKARVLIKHGDESVLIYESPKKQS